MNDENIGWYWYKPDATTLLRCRLIGRIGSLLTVETIYTGERINGRGRQVGGGWIVDAPK